MSETGHAKNIAAFELLTNFIAGFGSIYNPTTVELQPASLTALLANAKTSLSQIQTAFADWKDITNQRELAFESAKQLSTRSLNSFAVCGADDLAITDAKSFVRKLQGVRAKAIPAPKTAGEAIKTHSASQTGYDNKAEHFAQIVSIYEGQPQYKPNEAELQTAALATVSDDLRAKNSAVNSSSVALSNARRNRNEVLYHATNGLISVAADVKKYVKSVFGAASPQFKQINALRFKMLAK